MKNLSTDKKIVYMMIFTFVLPFSLAFTHSYFPAGYEVVLYIAVTLYSALVCFCGFAIPELYAKLFKYKRPEYDSCIKSPLDYVRRKRLWMSRIAAVIFAVAGFLISYFIKAFYVSLIVHGTEANAVGFSYELRLAIWSVIVIMGEGMIWFIPDELFLPDEANILYWIIPALVIVLIATVYFALHIFISGAILLVYYVLLYIRGARRAKRERAERREELAREEEEYMKRKKHWGE